MSDHPLYYNKSTPRQVNPIKLVPQISLAELEKKKTKNQLPSTNIYSTMAKEKKIAKQDKRKNYKTKMCPNGRECRKRFTCTYAHSEQQLRKPFIKRTKPCLLYQRGKCSLGSACREYHGNIDLKKKYKYKIQICKQFQEGKCQKGDVCIFLHEGEEGYPIEGENNDGSDEIEVEIDVNVERIKEQIQENDQKQEKFQEGEEPRVEKQKGALEKEQEIESIEEKDDDEENGFFFSF